jgi:hypothetical protein
MIPTTIRIRCQHPYVRIAQVFRIGQLSLHWITPGRQKSTNASTCGFFDSKEGALHRGISRQMRSLITRRSNLELTIAIEQWTPLSTSLAARGTKDRTEFLNMTARYWSCDSPLYRQLRPVLGWSFTILCEVFHDRKNIERSGFPCNRRRCLHNETRAKESAALCGALQIGIA